VLAAVRERIWRDVDDTHHLWRGQIYLKAGGFPKHLVCQQKRGAGPVDLCFLLTRIKPRWEQVRSLVAPRHCLDQTMVF
jgi:hypothetical protein